MEDYSMYEYQHVVYYIKRFNINVAGTSFDVPREMISNISIDKRFDVQIFPVYYISANVPMWLYSKMVDNNDGITVNWELQNKTVNEGQAEYYTFDGMKTEINGIFKVVIPTDTNISDSKLQNTIEQNRKVNEIGYATNEYAMVEMLLYNSAAWNMVYDKVNAVMSNTNLTDALTYTLGTGSISNVLLDKADNNTSYNEFKILPTSRIKNILRIIEDYNFHNDGSIVFFDLIQSYILSRKVGCRSWVNNEYKVTRFESLSGYDDALASVGGVKYDTDNKTNIIAFNKDSIRTENINDSPILQSIPHQLVMIKLDDVIMSMLTPNKDITLYADGANAKHNGRYMLYGYTLTLIKTGDFYKTDCLVYLRK